MKAIRNTHNNQRGYTIVELSIVMVVVGVIIAGISLGVVKLLASNRANDETKMLQQVVSTIQKHFANYADYSTISTSNEVKSGTFPDNLSNITAGTEANRWGGAVTLAASGGNARFTLTTTNVPSYECREVIPQLDGFTYTVSVNGSSVKAAGASTNQSSLLTACNSTTLNTIVYEFTK